MLPVRCAEAVREGGLEIGPIPAGTPVGLSANIGLRPDSTDLGARLGRDKELLDLVVTLVHDLKALPANASDDQARAVFANLRERMMRLSNCPDLVVNRGHYFGTELSDPDKLALIEFLKTF